MPNYSYQSNAIFEPMTFEQYIRPALMYGEAYKDVADQYDALSTQSKTFRERAMQEQDAQWAQRYMKYADGLEQAAQQLASDGLSQDIRSKLRQYKRDYGEVIEPINKAVQRQAELQKIADSADPRMRMLYGQMPSIQALIDNPNASRAGYSLTDVEGEAAALAKTTADRRQTAILEDIGRYVKTMETQGYSQEEINQFMQNSANIPELQSIVNSVYSMYGGFDGLDNYGKSQAMNAIMNGIVRGATYDQKVSFQTDQYDLENIRHAHERALKASGSIASPFGNVRSRTFINDTTNGKAKETYDTATKLMQNGFDIRDYIYDKNGNFVNPLKSYRNYSTSGSSITGYVSPYVNENAESGPQNKDKDVTRMLKAMGFTENDSEDKFLSLNKDTFDDYLSKMVSQYSYKAINILDNEQLNKVFKEGLNVGDDKRWRQMVHKTTSDWEDDGEVGKREFNELKNKDLEIYDAYYGAGNSGKVVLTTNKGTYLVDPAVLGGEMSNAIKSHEKDMKQFEQNPQYARDYITRMNENYMNMYGVPLVDDIDNKSDRWFVNQAIDMTINGATNDMNAWSNNWGQSKPKTSSKIQ